MRGRLCPVCSSETIGWRRAALALLGTRLKCPRCESQLVFGWFWRTGVMGIFFLSLAVGAVLSVKLRSYGPYALVPVAVLLAVTAGVAFGRLSVVMPRKPFQGALAWLLFVLFIGLLYLGMKSFGKVSSPFAHLAPPCQVAAWAAPLDFQELSAIRKKDRSESMQYLGECNAKKITDVLWFVSGIHYNSWMKQDGRPPVRYEAVMYEDNDASNPHVDRDGTQYTVCGVAAEGIDRTRLRQKRCGVGAYVLEFKKQYSP